MNNNEYLNISQSFNNICNAVTTAKIPEIGEYDPKKNTPFIVSPPLLNNSNNNCEYMHDDTLIITRLIDGSKNQTSTIETIDDVFSFMLVIDFPNGGGGTTSFLNRIISKYKEHQTFLIVRNYNGEYSFNINDEYDLLNRYTDKTAMKYISSLIPRISKIFINHTLGHTTQFMDFISSLNINRTTITHDYSLIYDTVQPLFNEISKIKLTPTPRYLKNCNTIITQHPNNLIFFGPFLNSLQNIQVLSLPDYYLSNSITHIPLTHTIIVAIIGNIIDLKGSQLFSSLSQYCKLNNIPVEFVVIGKFVNNPYNLRAMSYDSIHDFNNVLLHFKPNVIIELSLWPETYSFTLTLAMLTQLPIVYLKKPSESVIESRLLAYPNAHSFSDISQLLTIIPQVKQDYLSTISPYIQFQKEWDNIFITSIEKSTTSSKMYPKYDVNPFCIYFPQFHQFPENDKNFYPGFTDYKNLKITSSQKHSTYLTNKTYSLSTPLIAESYNNTYDLTNTSIIQHQINTLCEYNIPGFAIYFYWFAENSITNRHFIMEQMFNKFFDGSVELRDRKLFFIWANENWTDNVAFGNSKKEKIINTYDDSMFQQLVDDLIPYFKHPNYLVLDDCPIFMIHHPTDFGNSIIEQQTNIDMFISILRLKCIENGFNGASVAINMATLDIPYNFSNSNNNFNDEINDEFELTKQGDIVYYNHHFKYKYTNKSANKCTYFDTEDNQTYLDYQKYTMNLLQQTYNNTNIPHEFSNAIQSIAFDFNNQPRLFKPMRIKNSTICVNNSEFMKIKFVHAALHKYNNEHTLKPIDKILLINGWNEWGEQMTIEPSDEYKYYYLNFIQTYMYSSSNYKNINKSHKQIPDKLSQNYSSIMVYNKINCKILPKSCICGIAYNCEKYIHNIINNMISIGKIFGDYAIIIIYKQSTDNTLTLLRKFANENPKIMFYVAPSSSAAKTPVTVHNATMRNMYMSKIRQYYSDWDYFFVMDVIESNNKPINIPLLITNIYKPTWDCLSFNSPEYMNAITSLSTPEDDCLLPVSIHPYYIGYRHFENIRAAKMAIGRYLLSKLNADDGNDMVHCLSAFNGFALYKLKKFIDCAYSGVFTQSAFTPAMILTHVNSIKSNITTRYNLGDSEHRYFHFESMRKHGSQICISKDIIL